MLEVSRMPSYGAADGVLCESYTTPRTVQSDDDDTLRIKKEIKQDADIVTGEEEVIRNRDGVRSAPTTLHISTQMHKSLIEKLVEDSEQCMLDDSLVFESAVFDDWREVASGWRHVVPYPKYVTRQPQHAKSESGVKKGSGQRVSVRCVNDDLGGDVLCPSWKANVEPVTYRYIPNNGFYRSTKSNPTNVREWFAAKKNKSERVLITPEMRRAQKTLKRDLDSHFKGAGDLAPEPGTEPQAESSHQLSSVQSDNPIRIYHYSERRVPPCEQQLIKSASDLFMENFNSRLSALEKEIQTSYSPIHPKRHQGPGSGVHHSPVTVSRKLKESKVPDTLKSTSYGAHNGSPSISDDMFTVIPIACKPEVPLRPLEKVTPKHRQMEQTPSVSVDRTPSLVSSPENETKIILSSATSQPQAVRRDTDASQGINTARSAIAMTNFDIEKMRTQPFMERNVPLRPEFHTRTKSFLMQQGHSVIPNTRKGAMRYTSSQPQQQAMDQAVLGAMDRGVVDDFKPVVGRTREKEIDPLGGSLPEIMGKRLTVTSTTHRLL